MDVTTTSVKVYVKANGSSESPKKVILATNSTLEDVIAIASKTLGLEARRAFFSSGHELTDVDVEHIEPDEVIHISCGEAFKARTDGDAEIVGGYFVCDQLGQGGFGSVHKGVHAETGVQVAIKFVPKKTFREFSDLQRVFQEIQVLRNLRHPNIIRILDVADCKAAICFIMEFAPGGELREYVQKYTSLSEDESRLHFKQIVLAVHYCHSRSIIHRDLKLENILLDAELKPKIVDFGLSDYVSSKERTVTDAGTEAYLAPEVYWGTSGDSDPYKIDVWALGVILYAMSQGRLPFHRPDAEACALLDADGLVFGDESSAAMRRVNKAMLTVKASRRASMNDITTDPWVVQNRFATLMDTSEGALDAGEENSEPEGAETEEDHEEEDEVEEDEERADEETGGGGQPNSRKGTVELPPLPPDGVQRPGAWRGTPKEPRSSLKRADAPKARGSRPNVRAEREAFARPRESPRRQLPDSSPRDVPRAFGGASPRTQGQRGFSPSPARPPRTWVA